MSRCTKGVSSSDIAPMNSRPEKRPQNEAKSLPERVAIWSTGPIPPRIIGALQRIDPFEAAEVVVAEHPHAERGGHHGRRKKQKPERPQQKLLARKQRVGVVFKHAVRIPRHRVGRSPRSGFRDLQHPLAGLRLG